MVLSLKFNKNNFVITKKPLSSSSSDSSDSSSSSDSSDESLIDDTKKRKKSVNKKSKKSKKRKVKKFKKSNKKKAKKLKRLEKKKSKKLKKSKYKKLKPSVKRLDLLKSAIEIVKNNNININQCANSFGIPRSTLNNHFNGNAKGFGAGRPRAFTNDEEQSLVDLSIKLGERGFGLDKNTLISIASEFAKSIDKSYMFVNGIPRKRLGNFVKKIC
jgi:hypothetical protein